MRSRGSSCLSMWQHKCASSETGHASAGMAASPLGPARRRRTAEPAPGSGPGRPRREACTCRCRAADEPRLNLCLSNEVTGKPAPSVTEADHGSDLAAVRATGHAIASAASTALAIPELARLATRPQAPTRQPQSALRPRFSQASTRTARTTVRNLSRSGRSCMATPAAAPANAGRTRKTDRLRPKPDSAPDCGCAGVSVTAPAPWTAPRMRTC